MTVSVTVNPLNFEADYVRHLNECFGHWGDEELYNWAFRRTAGSHRSDLMVLRDEHGVVLAGSAVSYRRVEGAGRRFEVGIMTGSWTLPPSRGQGCFTRIIEESRLLSAEHGCALLLAFVTHDNASRRRLEDAGSRMIPSRYVFTAEGKEPRALLDVTASDVTNDELWPRVEASRGDAYHFTYPTLDDFVGQCIDRPTPTERVAVGTAHVVLEKTETTDRVVVADLGDESVEDVFESLAHRAQSAGRRFFGFAMGEREFAGLDQKDGFLTILGARESALEGASLDDLSPWHIDSGDRM